MSNMALMVTVNDVFILAVTRQDAQVVIDTYGTCKQIVGERTVEGDATGFTVLNFDEESVAIEAVEVLAEWSQDDDLVSIMYDPERAWASLTNQRTGDVVYTME